jgi:amino acid adenylation domain-containing protein
LTAADLLSLLESRGVALVADGDLLRVTAARGQLTEELKAAITVHKPALRALLAERAERMTPAVPRISRDGPLPLSSFQERLWVLNRLEPDSTDYNLVATWPSQGPADTTRVLEAIQSLPRRHEILRARYGDDGGVPFVRLLPPESVPVEVRDLRDRPEAEQQAEIRAAAESAALTPFDLAIDPVVRFVVFLVAGGRVVTLAAAHHIAVDGWSLGLLGQEVASAYLGSDPPPPPPKLQYADFAAWQRSPDMVRAAAAETGWWKRQLAGIPPLCSLPPDRSGSSRPTGATHAIPFGPELSSGIRAMAKEEGATVYMVVLSACASVLRWYNGQDDIVLGSPMGLRERPEFETIIGPFVNLLVLRMDLSDDPTFSTLLARARSALLDAHAHRNVRFEQLVEELNPTRSRVHSPLFQVAVVQPNVAGPASASVLGGGATFDLTFYVGETEGRLVGAIEYRSDLYTTDFIDRAALRLQSVLAAAVANRHRHLSETSLLLPDEERLVVHQFNATSRAIDPAPFPVQFARQARSTPDAPAVRFEGVEVTYRALDERSTQVARQLRTLGIGHGAIVGLCMPRSLDMVVALLGIQKTGAAYLPLDPDFPAERLDFMLADGGARALITNGPTPPGLAVPAGVARVDLAATRAAVEAQETGTLDGGPDPSDLAYLIYTSGSTGRPKGVRIRHDALSNFLGSMRDEPGLRSADVVAAVTTLSFDIAGLELYLPLTIGARIELLSKATASSGTALARALTESGATVLQATPATWRLLVQADWRAPPGFRALCGGEPLPRELADAILTRAGELWNLYGPTETTIWSTVERVAPGTGPILIGRPIANTWMYVLDRGGHPLPPGIAGEIWIGGAGVAEGYHGRPELTAQRFLADPFHPGPGSRMYGTGDLGRWSADGRLEHLGRLDHQVKVRGFRIELGEIESVLGTHPGVRHALAMAREPAAGDVRLIAYVVYQPGTDPTVSELRRHLRKQLPDYMIPSLFVTLDAMPLTPNGKVNRSALPDPFQGTPRSGAEHVPPAAGVEQVLADIWREILQVERVGAEDNFFELGGHSLLSLRVSAAVEKRLGWRMDPRALFFQNLRQVAATAPVDAPGGCTGAG